MCVCMCVGVGVWVWVGGCVCVCVPFKIGRHTYKFLYTLLERGAVLSLFTQMRKHKRQDIANKSRLLHLSA